MRSLRLLLNRGSEWHSRACDHVSVTLAEPGIARLPVRFWRDRNLLSGAVCEWLYYGSPDYPDVDCTLMILQRTPRHHMPPTTIEAELASITHLQSIEYGFSDRYFDLTTRLGPLAAREVTFHVDGSIKSALAFVSRFGDAPVFIKGWRSAARGEAIDPDLVATTIQSLGIASPLHIRAADTWLRARLSDATQPAACPVGGRRPEDAVI